MRGIQSSSADFCSIKVHAYSRPTPYPFMLCHITTFSLLGSGHIPPRIWKSQPCSNQRKAQNRAATMQNNNSNDATSFNIQHEVPVTNNTLMESVQPNLKNSPLQPASDTPN